MRDAADTVPEGSVSAQPQSRRELRERKTASLSVPSVPVPPIVPLSTLAPATAVVAPKGLRGRSRRTARAMRKLLVVGAMVGVAAMLVATSLPAGAFNRELEVAAAQQLAAPATTHEVQSLGVVADAAAAVPVVARDGYSAKSEVKPIKVNFVKRSFAYATYPSGSVQWPFPYAAPITYGFGARNACSYCSTFHMGLDFTPGAGTPIQAIADGVVTSVGLEGSYGNNVVIEHLINGQRVRSLYAHMAWGSIQVAVGQQVPVGTIVGVVGSTGASTGAHLHLEIHVEGTAIDPFPWLQANASGG